PEPLVGQGRALAPHVDRVGREVDHVLVDAAPEGVADGEQGDQHEDAPEDAGRGQRRAHLVLAERRADLGPAVEVEHGHSPRRASIGRTRAARQAGKNPASAPATTRSAVAASAGPKWISGRPNISPSGSARPATSTTTTPATRPR